jgi:Protein of unknown function (DUF3107)
VEIRIGIQSAPRELVIETTSSIEEVERLLRAAVTDGSVLVLASDKGGRVMIPADKLAYLEYPGSEPRRVGFGNIM